ncbi:hypothetical protein ACFX58_17390 [Sphingomonas sp. NCPPB 2930]
MHIASALFFDIGVFTLVVGATILILTSLAHQSVRAHRYQAREDGDEEQQVGVPVAEVRAAAAAHAKDSA